MFGFKEVEHKQYNKNFLKTVVFQVQYNKVKDFNNKKKAIIEVFESIFPRVTSSAGGGIEIVLGKSQTPIVQQVKVDDNIEMKSDNGQKLLHLTSTSLSFTISGQEYESYTNLKSDIQRINDFFKICEIEQVTRTAIRKINIVDFKFSDTPFEIFNSLINPQLIGNLEYYPNKFYLKKTMHLLSYENGKHNLNINFGLNLPELNFGQVIIDLDLFCVDLVHIQQIYNITDSINKEIFNAFNWVVTKNTLDLLNE